jgi:hypothetical protein
MYHALSCDDPVTRYIIAYRCPERSESIAYVICEHHYEEMGWRSMIGDGIWQSMIGDSVYEVTLDEYLVYEVINS